ncbi:hypothetical protein J2858_002104 [Neorhizobium galegae]|uniref:SHOCT domain-containing protein n=1 Tax=Neorhizobium galegae TaxID=399 RepID=UPI001AE3F315|nr:SHOCT domain-containing protein [Neorhizobium galegae]MBP2549181.1 hypothetical protein [Neorhizobium galegae]
MQGLTEETHRVIADLARQYGLSEDAVLAMLMAVQRGQGTMAQFNIGELGGSGQWMLGGMTMVGDMFNYGLKNTVDSLCNALSQALAAGRIVFPTETGGASVWWPQHLGSPSSAGAQNDSAYAVFPAQRRLAIKDAGGVTLYDTGDHFISGVGQQQGSNSGLTFSSQYGSFSVSSLRRADEPAEPVQPQEAWAPPLSDVQPSAAPKVQPLQQQPAAIVAPAPSGEAAGQAPPAPAPSGSTAPKGAAEIIGLIEKLASLREAGILTDAEFSAKKTELLARL